MNNCICCCGVTDSRKRFGFDELRCRECGFVHYCNGISVNAELYSNSEKYQNYKEKSPLLWYHKKALKFLNLNDKVHDLGCHDGFFVKYLIDSGINADGSDWDRRAILAGSASFGLKDKLTESPHGLYDKITALEVLEHFEKPDQFFEIINNHLQSKGCLILSVPNRHSFYRPGVDYPPHHFSRFCERSLRLLAEKHNYGIIHIDTEMNTQMFLRNFIGDKMRKNTVSFDNQNYSKKYYILKFMYNRISIIMERILTPFNFLLKLFGFRYGSIFVVLKRNV